MSKHEFVTYDVFTDTRFAGNPLAVVLDAQGLTTEQMQTIAREFNLAESTFVLPPENPENTARVRIFTPAYEMPFAGHPTVGTSIALATRRGLGGNLKLELNAGVFPVSVELSGDGGCAEFQNPNLPLENGDAPSVEALEAALSLDAGTLDKGSHRPRRIGAGVDFIYTAAPLDVVRRAKVNSAAWEALGMENTIGVYLYAKGGEAPDADFHARMFAPDAGVLEDPATGSAAAAFPGQIALSEKLPDGEMHWIVEQGFEMGRPSRIAVTTYIKNGKPSSVRIGGNAVFVQQGQISV